MISCSRITDMVRHYNIFFLSGLMATNFFGDIHHQFSLMRAFICAVSVARKHFCKCSNKIWNTIAVLFRLILRNSGIKSTSSGVVGMEGKQQPCWNFLKRRLQSSDKKDTNVRNSNFAFIFRKIDGHLVPNFAFLKLNFPPNFFFNRQKIWRISNCCICV